MAIGRSPRADWRRGERYDYLNHVERAMFAWEWLRRTGSYRRAWGNATTLGAAAQAIAAARFGLVEFLPPSLTAREARPIWSADRDPRVIPARAIASAAQAEDRFDIRRVAEMASIGLDGEDVEHWRIGTAARSIRLDVRAGTLLGGPTLLSYDLAGLERLRPKLAPLQTLLVLALASRPGVPAAREARATRWIAELRTADALTAGATQQDIARALFGGRIPSGRWRGEGESYRLRVQRLVRAAQAHLLDPVSPEWFR